MAVRLERLGPLSAVLAAVTFLALFLVALLLDPAWRIGEMWVSDLGVRPGAWAFNAGCILAGLLVLPFGVSVPRVLHPGRIAQAGALLLLAMAGFLVAVGVFTEDFGGLHTFVSFGFFLTLLLAWLVLLYPMHRTTAFGGWGGAINGVFLAVSVASAALFNAFTLEAIIILAAVAWGLLVGGLLLLRPVRVPDRNVPSAS